MAGQSGVYRGVSAQDRVAERRRRLLEATLGVWAAAGTGDTRVTMTAVCAEAGLTERYFYESFRSLDEALVAVLEEVATEIEQRTQAAADTAGGDPAARVRASLRAFVELLVEDPRKGRVSIVQAGAMPALRGRRTQLLRHFAHRAAEETALLGDPGSRSDPDREIAGLMFVGGLAELVTAWLDGALDATPDQIVAAGSRMLLGSGNPPTPPPARPAGTP